jgi:hypothetical protein
MHQTAFSAAALLLGLCLGSFAHATNGYLMTGYGVQVDSPALRQR